MPKTEKNKILIVDDKPENLLSMEKVLEDLNIDIIKVTSGNEALRRVLEHEFAVVLLDVMMPEMDGFEVAELMRGFEETEKVPIIFITAVDRDEKYVSKGYEAGAVDFLCKPIDRNIVRSKVQVFCELHRQKKALKMEIDARVQAENELKQTAEELGRSNAELEQFAYVASHDLQEPLRAVTGCLQLLQKRYRGQLDSTADEFIWHAVDGAQRMRTLINDLLAYSRVGTRGKPLEPTHCAEILEEVLGNLAVAIEESGAKVTHDPLPEVMADATQLIQLVQNLVGNGIKFRSDKAPEIHIGVDGKDEMWRFSVRDNGIGIDGEYAERIFVIFQRLHTREKYDGTGIGLAICKKIVERHGGQIWMESQPEAGTTFYFTIPVRDA